MGHTYEKHAGGAEGEDGYDGESLEHGRRGGLDGFLWALLLRAMLLIGLLKSGRFD